MLSTVLASGFFLAGHPGRQLSGHSLRPAGGFSGLEAGGHDHPRLVTCRFCRYSFRPGPQFSAFNGFPYCLCAWLAIYLKVETADKITRRDCSGYSQQCRHGPGYFLSVIKNEFRRGIDGLSFRRYSGHLAG